MLYLRYLRDFLLFRLLFLLFGTVLIVIIAFE
jgi:hypothetical protein